ncbi:XRE family transcriptional regulator [Rhizobium sp. Root1203]|jgi:transcriptional regulator with XRE-family HTH domain|uniref:helix-turn-helix domain-containing protein n=1 Tax=Rhizobium sp. Root1203 TaxID=1736427 RepID=UPI00070CDA05|nr:helix-turn-helix domain-containing protein [Rhizobium sp. Root1203]KQV32225.1 XRE family transcriptional regulator [Rhizobium sp. Root1203]
MSISLNNLDKSNVEAVSAIHASAAIRAAREAIGYSVDDLAVTCGLLVSEIQEVENGEDTDPAKLKRIAAALQMPLTAFIPE